MIRNEMPLGSLERDKPWEQTEEDGVYHVKEPLTWLFSNGFFAVVSILTCAT